MYEQRSSMYDQRSNVFLWLGYTVALLLLLFVSGGIFARFPLLGSVPDCLPVAIAFVAVLEGRFFGSVYGMGAGLLVTLTHAGHGSGMILLGALIGMFAGGWYERKLRRFFGPCMMSAALALLAAALIRGVAALCFSTGATPLAVLRIGGLEAIYSLLLAVPAYPMFLFVHKHLSNG